MQQIIKLCADNVRNFANSNDDIRLKASHSHELVAACFGYKSKAALLADTEYPISNMKQAHIVVLPPTAQIDLRRQSLSELPANLPNTTTISEIVYSVLVNEKFLLRMPWTTYGALAQYLADEDLRQKKLEKAYRGPVRESVNIEHSHDYTIMTVFRFYQAPRRDFGVDEINIMRNFIPLAHPVAFDLITELHWM